MGRLSSLWDREPAVILGLVGAALALGTSFGLHLSSEQIGSIMAFTTALIAFVTRSQVTPTSGATAPPSIDMRNRLSAWLLPLLLLAGLGLSACASLPVKQRATTTLQSVETALGAAQDLERANHTVLGLDVAATPAQADLCTVPEIKATYSQTKLPTRHQVISCLFAEAFDTEVHAATQLQAWQAGQTPPTLVGQLKDEIDVLFAFARSVVIGASAQQLLASIQSGIDAAIQVLSVVKG